MRLTDNKILIASTCRIQINERKKGVYYYDIRHSDDNGFEPVTVEDKVMVNHFATIGLEKPLEFTEDYLTLNDKEKRLILEKITS